MPHSPEDKKKALNRLRRIKGQADALERAIEEGIECRALLQQIAALRGASNGLMAEILDMHLRELFGSQSAPPAVPELERDPDTEIDAVMKLLRTYLK